MFSNVGKKCKKSVAPEKLRRSTPNHANELKLMWLSFPFHAKLLDLLRCSYDTITGRPQCLDPHSLIIRRCGFICEMVWCLISLNANGNGMFITSGRCT